MKRVKKVDCTQAGELLLDFLENALSPDTRAALDRHFGHCKPCLGFLETYKKTPGLCKKALLKQIPDEMSERLLGFLRHNASGGRKKT